MDIHRCITTLCYIWRQGGTPGCGLCYYVQSGLPSLYKICCEGCAHPTPVLSENPGYPYVEAECCSVQDDPHRCSTFIWSLPCLLGDLTDQVFPITVALSSQMCQSISTITVVGILFCDCACNLHSDQYNMQIMYWMCLCHPYYQL